MKKALMIVSVLIVAVISTACINNIAVQELNNKAAEFMQKGDYESAMNRLQASLDLDATMYQTYYNLGVAAISAKKYDKAIQALEDGIKIKPDFADFYYSLGVAQISMADEILEPEEDAQSEDTVEETPKKTEPADEDIAKAKELKQLAIDNLNKYIEMAADIKDRDSIDEMIKQSEEFISGEKKEEVKE
ncbi:tetratricopeptide repeat protein [bacterium]|nr:tetratricopeptide repeat protein [bacterium]